MRLLRNIITTSTFLLFTFISFSFGIESIAVSPDGKTVVTAGGNYAFYVINNADKTIKKRVRVDFGQGTPDHLWFSKDGKSLWYVTSMEMGQYETATWTKKKTVDVSKTAISKDHSTILTFKPYKKKFQVINADNGSVKSTFIHNLDIKVDNYSFDLATGTIFLLHRTEETSDEKKERIPYAELKEMPLIKRIEASNKSDGKSRKFSKLKLADGSLISEGETWLSKAYSTHIVSFEQDFYILTGEGSVKITKSNATETLNLSTDYDEFAISKDGNSFIAADKESVTAFDFKTAVSKTTQIDGEHMESVVSVESASDGVIIGLSSYKLKFVSNSGGTKNLVIL